MPKVLNAEKLFKKPETAASTLNAGRMHRVNVIRSSQNGLGT